MKSGITKVEQPFRVYPFCKRQIEGIQKYYFEDGKLMAEIPY